MNLHVFWIHATIATLLFRDAFSKTLPETDDIDSDQLDETEAVHDTLHRHHKGLKHAQQRGDRRRRADDETISNKNLHCAVMYKNEEPVGILRPYKDSYELLPIHDDERIPVEISALGQPVEEDARKRDAGAETVPGVDEEPAQKGDDVAPFTDDKYPYIFAKFKIDSRIGREGDGNDQRGKNKNLAKRQTLFSQKHVNSLKSTLSRIETNEDGAEAELKDILNDMGLIDNTPIEKRDAAFVEDEDLERGTNKINLIKVDNGINEVKRTERKVKPLKAVTNKQYAMIDFPEPKFNEDEYIDQYMKKHPEALKQLENHDKEKRSNDEKPAKDEEQRSDKKRSEDMAEEMERQIKQRLQKIKEEVTNEIQMIKGNSDDEDLEDDDYGEDEDGIKTQRKKRDALNTLVEEETSDLNPVLFGENNLIPHIRRRREIEDEGAIEAKDDESATSDGILIIDLNADATDINNRKSQDYTILATNQYVATTTPGYLTRNLQESKADEAIYDEDVEDKQKRACKCSGKDCNCGEPKPLLGEDGSSYFYIDGAPQLVEGPVYVQSDVAALHVLPQSGKNVRRSSRQNVGHVATEILRGLRDGGYTLDLDPDVYRIVEEKSGSSRRKRDSFRELVAIHGGSPALDHLLAIRERSMWPRSRVKRGANEGKQLTLNDMSEEDMFGGLPQGYEGELARYKRVKRAT